MGKPISSEKLEQLLGKLSSDEKLRQKVMEDKESLAELGWSPEAIAGFGINADAKGSNCGSWCGCTSYIGQGCKGHQGVDCSCSGGSGAGR